MTNFEKIKQMSVEELAELLSFSFDCSECSESQELNECPLVRIRLHECDRDCITHCKEWLENEAEE